jgi:hypothetical protein
VGAAPPTALPLAAEAVVAPGVVTAVPPGDSELPMAVTPAAGADGPTLTVDDVPAALGTPAVAVDGAASETAAVDGAATEGAAVGAAAVTAAAGVPVGDGTTAPPNPGDAFAGSVPDGVVPDGVAPNGAVVVVVEPGARMSVPPTPAAAPTGDGEVLTGGVPSPPPVTPPGPGPPDGAGTEGWVAGGLTCASATAPLPNPGAPATVKQTAT